MPQPLINPSYQHVLLESIYDASQNASRAKEGLLSCQPTGHSLTAVKRGPCHAFATNGPQAAARRKARHEDSYDTPVQA